MNHNWHNLMNESFKDGRSSVQLLEEAYQMGKAEMLEESIEVVHSYFKNLIDKNPDWEIDSIDDFALIPNKEICEALRLLLPRKE